MTAFEDQMGRSYRGRLYQWAQPVMARLPAALEQSKMAARWMPGIWMGRRADADDHLVAIGPNKVLCTRACRMLTLTTEPVEDYKYAKNLLQTWMEPIDDD
eukprot:7857935-Heterocapsa_arctica.AAC.1